MSEPVDVVVLRDARPPYDRRLLSVLGVLWLLGVAAAVWAGHRGQAIWGALLSALVVRWAVLAAFTVEATKDGVVIRFGRLRRREVTAGAIRDVVLAPRGHRLRARRLALVLDGGAHVDLPVLRHRRGWAERPVLAQAWSQRRRLLDLFALPGDGEILDAARRAGEGERVRLVVDVDSDDRAVVVAVWTALVTAFDEELVAFRVDDDTVASRRNLPEDVAAALLDARHRARAGRGDRVLQHERAEDRRLALVLGPWSTSAEGWDAGGRRLWLADAGEVIACEVSAELVPGVLEYLHRAVPTADVALVPGSCPARGPLGMDPAVRDR